MRGVIFTGFPWLAVGYSQTFPSPLAGYVPVLGVYGVSLVVAVSAALLHDFLTHRKGRKRWSIALLFGMWAVGAGLQQVHWTSPRSEERRVGKECVRPCRSWWSRIH